MADAPARRTLCSRCSRPPVVCYCAALPTPPLRLTRTRVAVLQHTREQRQRQSISSVPVLANAFEDAGLRVLPVDVDGRRDDSAPQQHATIRALQEQLLQAQQQQQISSLDAEAPSILVLFPTADAQPLTPRPQREPRDDQADATTLLVAIDGTWTEAKKIVHHLEALWTSLDVQFVTLATAPSSGSIYGELRREPMDGCVSTLEARGRGARRAGARGRRGTRRASDAAPRVPGHGGRARQLPSARASGAGGAVRRPQARRVAERATDRC
ncbi:hypothetical protein PINS_up019292 [Pythium insidiosum]|nr:hypothetical protein PINS_up019292 [Pythium insidiosum]